MRMIRILVRLPFFVVWTLFCALTAIPFGIVLPGKAAFCVISRYWRIYTRVSAFIFGMKIVVHGNTDDIHEFNGLIISNHCGYLDIYAHGALFNMRLVSKLDGSCPFLRALGYITLRPIWVNRLSPLTAEACLTEMRDYLKSGRALVIYPEGTSTDGKNGILPFKTTAFEAIRGTNIPIQPLITIYRTKEGDSPVCYIMESAPFPLHFMSLLGNREYECHIFVMQKFYSGNMNRKQMALKLHQMMNEEYQRIINGKLFG